MAKFTPSPSQVAPSGYGDPGQTIGVCTDNWAAPHLELRPPSNTKTFDADYDEIKSLRQTHPTQPIAILNFHLEKIQ
jgi:hypothetical protein